MASKKRDRKETAPSLAPATEIWDRLASPRTIFLGLAAAVLLFYFKPLFSEGSNVKQALEDTFWALLNSREFLFNH